MAEKDPVEELKETLKKNEAETRQYETAIVPPWTTKVMKPFRDVDEDGNVIEGMREKEVKVKTPYDRQEIWNLTNLLLMRGTTAEEPAKYRLTGDFECRSTTWRIIGLAESRVEQRLSYDVFRLNIEDYKQAYLSYPREQRQQLLHVCNSDDPTDHKNFLHEYRMLKLLSDVYVNWRQRRHFPELYGLGAFKMLNYRVREPDLWRHMKEGVMKKVNLEVPRPYFIVERLSFTVESLMFMTKNSTLDLPTACYLTIGMIKALRLIHELGYAMRFVSPSCFSVRLPPSNMLYRCEVELADRIAITSLPFAFKYIHAKRVIPTCGNYLSNTKYSSPDSMELKGQTSIDDIVSVFFIFHEMVNGRLPWATLMSNDEEIIAEKRKLMKMKSFKDIKEKDVAHGYDVLFEIVTNSCPYLFSLDYEDLYRRIHGLCANTKPEFSLFGLSAHIRRAYAGSVYEDDREVMSDKTKDKTKDQQKEKEREKKKKVDREKEIEEILKKKKKTKVDESDDTRSKHKKKKKPETSDSSKQKKKKKKQDVSDSSRQNKKKPKDKTKMKAKKESVVDDVKDDDESKNKKKKKKTKVSTEEKKKKKATKGETVTAEDESVSRRKSDMKTAQKKASKMSMSLEKSLRSSDESQTESRRKRKK